MAAVVREIEPGKWMFWCPGCQGHHWYALPMWSHDGQLDAPTVTPSIVTPVTGCHLWLRAGQIVYLTDCRHELAGKTVPMVALGGHMTLSEGMDVINAAREAWEVIRKAKEDGQIDDAEKRVIVKEGMDVLVEIADFLPGREQQLVLKGLDLIGDIVDLATGAPAA